MRDNFGFDKELSKKVKQEQEFGIEKMKKEMSRERLRIEKIERLAKGTY